MSGKNDIVLDGDNQARITKIMNVLCNTTILLMSLMTEALTDVFTKMSKEMITALSTGLEIPADAQKEMHHEADSIQNELPRQMREQLLAMKVDITKQLREKKGKVASIIEDKRFDEGITIVERYKFNFPNLSCDLDECSLLGYFALLQNNNDQFSAMFQELLEWMKKLPLT